MKTEFEKSIYCPNERARAIMHVDNTRCSNDTTEVSLVIHQKLEINIEGRRYHIDP